eukprot:358338-Rhodomonas_salina.1
MASEALAPSVGRSAGKEGTRIGVCLRTGALRAVLRCLASLCQTLVAAARDMTSGAERESSPPRQTRARSRADRATQTLCTALCTFPISRTQTAPRTLHRPQGQDSDCLHQHEGEIEAERERERGKAVGRTKGRGRGGSQGVDRSPRRCGGLRGARQREAALVCGARVQRGATVCTVVCTQLYSTRPWRALQSIPPPSLAWPRRGYLPSSRLLSPSFVLPFSPSTSSAARTAAAPGTHSRRLSRTSPQSCTCPALLLHSGRGSRAAGRYWRGERNWSYLAAGRYWRGERNWSCLAGTAQVGTPLHLPAALDWGSSLVGSLPLSACRSLPGSLHSRLACHTPRQRERGRKRERERARR